MNGGKWNINLAKKENICLPWGTLLLTALGAHLFQSEMKRPPLHTHQSTFIFWSLSPQKDKDSELSFCLWVALLCAPWAGNHRWFEHSLAHILGTPPKGPGIQN